MTGKNSRSELPSYQFHEGMSSAFTTFTASEPRAETSLIRMSGGGFTSHSFQSFVTFVAFLHLVSPVFPCFRQLPCSASLLHISLISIFHVSDSDSTAMIKQ